MAENQVRMVHKLDGLDMTLRVTLGGDEIVTEFLDAEGKKVTDPAQVQAALDHLQQVETIELDLDRSE
jgi:hypothetical protein